jgi:hypothetical protein
MNKKKEGSEFMFQSEERKGFTFFRSYYESAIKLPDKKRLGMYDAILKYSFEGDADALDGANDDIVRAILLLIRPALDNSMKKSIAGTKGGKSNCKSHINSAVIKSEADNKQNRSRSDTQGYQCVNNQEADTGQIVNDKNNKSVSHNIQREEYSDTDLKQLGFNEFWNAYPRKVGKAAAKKIWNRIKPDTDLQTTILAAIEQQKNSSQWQCDNGQFIPNPSTWLSQCRWDDELPESTGSSKLSNFTQRNYTDENFDKFITNEFGKAGRRSACMKPEMKIIGIDNMKCNQ